MHRSPAAAAVAPLWPDVAALFFSCSSDSHFLHAAFRVRVSLRAAPAVATRRAAQKMTHCSSVYPSFCGTATHKLSVHSTNTSRHSKQLQAPDRIIPLTVMPLQGDRQRRVKRDVQYVQRLQLLHGVEDVAPLCKGRP